MMDKNDTSSVSCADSFPITHRRPAERVSAASGWHPEDAPELVALCKAETRLLSRGSLLEELEAIRTELAQTELIRARHELKLRGMGEDHPFRKAEAAFIENLKQREAAMIWEIKRRTGSGNT